MPTTPEAHSRIPSLATLDLRTRNFRVILLFFAAVFLGDVIVTWRQLEALQRQIATCASPRSSCSADICQASSPVPKFMDGEPSPYWLTLSDGRIMVGLSPLTAEDRKRMDQMSEEPDPLEEEQSRSF